ncbi:MAG: glutathione S-transferase family protein [Burkholderiales bacterium]
MLKLFENPLSAYVMKVKIALHEKGLDFESISAQGLMDGTAGGEFVEANPRAEIPALVDGDVSVFDSTVILEYLEEKWPEPPLLPKSPVERARLRMIEDVMDTKYEANNWGLFEVTRFGRASGPLADKLIAFGKSNIEQLQGWLDKQLGSAPWFNGDRFGWGDLSVAPYLNRSAAYGYVPRKGFRLAGWLERANARDSVSKVRAQMQAAVDSLPDLAQMVRNRKIVRQYRDHRLEWMIAGGGLSVVSEGFEKGTIRFSRSPS